MSDVTSEGRKHPAYLKAAAFVIEEQRISMAGIQRKFRLSYAEAASIAEALALDGVCTDPGEDGMRDIIPASLHEWNPGLRKGLALEKLGVLMQDPKTTIKDLAGAAHDAGITISVSIEDSGENPA